MAVHDWTKVSQGIFHHFHNAWTLRIADLLNAGILPSHVYALSEQVAGGVVPDVIAIEVFQKEPGSRGRDELRQSEAPTGATSLMPPPTAAIVAKTENVTYAALQRTVVIRHIGSHAVVALIEIVSRGNKSSKAELDRFLAKAQSALKQGIHLLIVDVHPGGRLDPRGIHGLLWSALGEEPPELPSDKPLVASAYEAGAEVTAYVEPFGREDSLPEMPLFLAVSSHVPVPLQRAYDEAFESVPVFWRREIGG